MTEDIWDEKPTLFVEKLKYEGIVYLGDITFTTEDEDNFIREIQKFDAWLEKLKAHYEPYDALLKAEPLMPLDIRSVLEKEGMPILIDEGRFNELREKADKWVLLEKVGGPPQGDKRIQWHIDMSNMRLKLEAVKEWVEKHGDSVGMYQANWDELDKILEVEG